MNRFLPFLLVLIAIVIYVLYINPTYTGRVATANAAIASDDQALAALSSYTAKENELLAQKNQISSQDLALASELLPASVNNVQVILDLNNLAAASGLALSSVDVAGNTGNANNQVAGVPISSVGSVDLELSASGTYAAFRSFLAGIERSARILDIENVAIKGSNTGVYSYSITLRLYWLH